jgi:hypothetical protein
MRLTAKKVRVSDVLNGKFFYGSKEGMKPSYVISLGMKFSRANLVGTVTDKFFSEDGSYASLTIDDGTGAIRIKGFREKTALLAAVEKGDLVLAVGKVKEYNGERYVNCEVVRKIDINYESLRKLEIAEELQKQKKLVENARSDLEKMNEEEVKEKYGIDEEVLQAIRETVEVDYKPKVLEILSSLDEGDGVEIAKLFEIVSLPENVIEKTLDELISEGYVYEPTPGKIKKI